MNKPKMVHFLVMSVLIYSGYAFINMLGFILIVLIYQDIGKSMGGVFTSAVAIRLLIVTFLIFTYLATWVLTFFLEDKNDGTRERIRLAAYTFLSLLLYAVAKRFFIEL